VKYPTIPTTEYRPDLCACPVRTLVRARMPREAVLGYLRAVGLEEVIVEPDQVKVAEVLTRD
jgi:hypothetical protein